MSLATGNSPLGTIEFSSWNEKRRKANRRSTNFARSRRSSRSKFKLRTSGLQNGEELASERAVLEARQISNWRSKVRTKTRQNVKTRPPTSSTNCALRSPLSDSVYENLIAQRQPMTAREAELAETITARQAEIANFEKRLVAQSQGIEKR